MQSKPTKLAVVATQIALAGTAAAVALMAGSAVCRADPLEPSLIGAWATSAPDCAKLFVGQRGGLAYRAPADKFAQASIIGPQQIRSPSSTCHVQSVSHEKGAIKGNAECEDSIGFQQQSARIRMQPSGEIVYSTTGDPALDTTLTRCRPEALPGPLGARSVPLDAVADRST
jgi:hypothetical protein